jgi:hypothetical protein
MARPTSGTFAGFDEVVDTTKKRSWRSQVDRFKRHHDATCAAPFEEFEPAYHYGWDMGNDVQFQRRWAEIEEQLRDDWERRYPDGPWERLKDAIRFGWERATEVPRSSRPDSRRAGR